MNERRNLTIPVMIGSAGIIVFFQLLLIALKVSGAIEWGWGWVLWPLFLSTVLAFCILPIALFVHVDHN